MQLLNEVEESGRFGHLESREDLGEKSEGLGPSVISVGRGTPTELDLASLPEGVATVDPPAIMFPEEGSGRSFSHCYNFLLQFLGGSPRRGRDLAWFSWLTTRVSPMPGMDAHSEAGFRTRNPLPYHFDTPSNWMTGNCRVMEVG